jgi:hypothetical protein
MGIRDPSFSLCPWWGEDCMLWCHSKCFCIHCKRCWISCFARASPHSFILQSFCWQVESVLLIASIYTLVDVIIVNFTWTDLVAHAAFSRGVVASLAVQVKKGFYCDHYSANVFFLLVIEVFSCFHQQADNFLHWCVNITWIIKGNKGLPLSVLHSFYRQKV